MLPSWDNAICPQPRPLGETLDAEPTKPFPYRTYGLDDERDVSDHWRDAGQADEIDRLPRCSASSAGAPDP
jgi:hypothetical protein